MSQTQSVIEFRSVTKRFGDVAAVVDNDLAVKPGEFLSILGPSGCGKTTSLRMMAGFEQPTAGEVFLRGRVLFRRRAACAIHIDGGSAGL